MGTLLDFSKTRKRQIEIFSAGCSTCKETIKLVQSLACDSCNIKVLDMNARRVAAKAEKYGLQKVPATVIDGKRSPHAAPIVAWMPRFLDVGSVIK